jgi:hypothetical protein
VFCFYQTRFEMPSAIPLAEENTVTQAFDIDLKNSLNLIV